MKTNLTPRKAPGLLLQLLNEQYGFAVNCLFPNSFRILNRMQFEILNAVNGCYDIEEIALQSGSRPEELEKLFSILAKTEIIRFDNNFSTLQKPENPNSLNFWIHTTDACNLGCSYCYISTLNTSKGMQDNVQRQLLYKMMETAAHRKIRHIKLRLAGGEPLSQFKTWKAFIPDAVKSLAALGCKLDISFITNLTILNEDILAFSKEYNITYGVSLDGVDTIHDASRAFRSGLGSFRIVDANLRKLLAENIPVSVNTVITNKNLEGLPELTHHLISMDVPFRYSIVRGENINGTLLDKYLTESFRIMGEAIEGGWQFSKRHQFCDLKPNDLGFQTCASGFSGGAIYVDGSFKYCHVHFGNEQETGHSIFNSELDLLDMIEQGNHHEDQKSEDCKQCRFRSVCTSGCPVYRINGKDPQCSLYHKFIPLYYELQAKERLNLLRLCQMI